jgi:uncharacterized protein (DUF2267 family)
MKDHIAAFDRTLQKTREWVDELDAELGWGDRPRAYTALKAVLHALRDRLPVEETADLAAQLPMLVRGFFFEGWKPVAPADRARHLDEFLAPVARALAWESATMPEEVARAVFALLRRHVTEGELEDVLRVLPVELRQLFEERPVAY